MPAADLQQRLWSAWTAGLSPAAQQVQRLFQRRRETPTPQWHAVIVDEISLPRVQRYGSLRQMLQHLHLLASQDVYVAPFFGLPGGHAKVPDRPGQLYFVHPDGRQLPLYDPTAPAEVNYHGYLGAPPPNVDEAELDRLAQAMANQPQSFIMEEAPEVEDNFGLDEDVGDDVGEDDEF